MEVESKAVGFVPLLKAYGFGLRVPDLFTDGFYLIWLHYRAA